MKFSDIKFIKDGRPHGSSIGLYLAGHWVSKDLFDLMWIHASQSLPKVDWSRKQTSADVFGDKDLWVSHKVGRRIALGRCLKYFADRDILPIRVANPGKKGPRRYVRN